MKTLAIKHRYIIWLFVILALLNACLVVTHYTKFPALQRLQFLWFIGTLSDSVAAGLMFLEMRAHTGNRLVQFYAMAWLAVAIESWCGLVANIYPPVSISPIHYPLWHACFFWSGRWGKSYAVLLVSLFQRGAINGYHTHPDL